MTNLLPRFITASLCLTFGTASIAPAQAADSWKTFTNKDAGFSMRLPSNAVLKVNHLTTKSGTKLILLNGQGTMKSGATYGVIISRADRAEANRSATELEQMQASFVDWIAKTASSDPKRYTVSRKPVNRFGLRGEDMIATDIGTKDIKPSFFYVRIVKDPKTRVMLLAIERKPNSSNRKDVDIFMESFRRLPSK